MKKKMLATVVVILLAMTQMPAIISETLIENNERFLTNSFDSRIICNNFESPYEYGEWVGENLAAWFSGFNFEDLIGEDNISIELEWLKSIKDTCDIANFSYEELKGLADALDINIEDVVYLQKLMDSIVSEECTTTLSTIPATKNGETFLTKNMDGNISMPECLLIFFYHYFS